MAEPRRESERYRGRVVYFLPAYSRGGGFSSWFSKRMSCLRYSPAVPPRQESWTIATDGNYSEIHKFRRGIIEKVGRTETKNRKFPLLRGRKLPYSGGRGKKLFPLRETVKSLRRDSGTRSVPGACLIRDHLFIYLFQTLCGLLRSRITAPFRHPRGKRLRDAYVQDRGLCDPGGLESAIAWFIMPQPQPQPQPRFAH